MKDSAAEKTTSLESFPATVDWNGVLESHNGDVFPDARDFNWDLDLCGDMAPNTFAEDAPALGITMTLTFGKAKNPELRHDILKRQHKVEEYMWRSIVFDMLDELIVKSSWAHNGSADGDERTVDTREFFWAFVGGDTFQKLMRRIVDFVNDMHRAVGVRVESEGEEPRIAEKYLAAFNFVLAAITHHMSLFFEKEMDLSPAELATVKQQIFDVWFRQAGILTGLQSIPKDVQAMEEFYEEYLRRSKSRMQKKGSRAREQARVTARAFIPALANASHCSEQEFVEGLADSDADLYAILKLESPLVPQTVVDALLHKKHRIGVAMGEFNQKHMDGWSAETEQTGSRDRLIRNAQRGIGAVATWIRGKIQHRFRSNRGEQQHEKEKRRQYDAMIDALDDGIMGAQSPDVPCFENAAQLAQFLLGHAIGGITGYVRQSLFGKKKQAAAAQSETATVQQKKERAPERNFMPDPSARTLFHILRRDPQLAIDQKLRVEEATLQPGDTLTEYGEDPGCIRLVIVDEGELGVFLPGDDTFPVAIHAKSPKAVSVAEMTMYAKEIRAEKEAKASATVRATRLTKIRYISISPTAFKALLHAHPNNEPRIKQALLPLIQKRVRENVDQPFINQRIPELLRDINAVNARLAVTLLESEVISTTSCSLQARYTTLRRQLQLYVEMNESDETQAVE